MRTILNMKPGPGGRRLQKELEAKTSGSVYWTHRLLPLIVPKITKKASKKFSKELKEARCLFL